jgi:mutator protein MutT
MKEELGVEVAVQDLFCEVLYPYPHHALILYFYRCSIQSGEIRPLGCQEFKWVPAHELSEYTFPPANLPLVTELMALKT